IEELVHKLVICTVEAAASLRGFVGWKLYQAGDKVHFDSDYARGLTKADSAVQSIGKAGILHLAIPTPLMPVREGDPRLTRYALALCRRGALGGMDAFHAAVARLAGIEWIASCDRDFVV